MLNRPQNFSSLPWGEALWFSSYTQGIAVKSFKVWSSISPKSSHFWHLPLGTPPSKLGLFYSREAIFGKEGINSLDVQMYLMTPSACLCLGGKSLPGSSFIKSLAIQFIFYPEKQMCRGLKEVEVENTQQ